MRRSTLRRLGAARKVTGDGRRAILRDVTRPSDPQPDVAHYADGSLQSTGFLLDGEMHGAWAFYRKDGTVMRTGEFSRGRQVGTWRTLARDGRLVKQTVFRPAASDSEDAT